MWFHELGLFQETKLPHKAKQITLQVSSSVNCVLIVNLRFLREVNRNSSHFEQLPAGKQLINILSLDGQILYSEFLDLKSYRSISL